ncbi:hypothetical protein HDU92_004345 [Lobulomyces angularis]|nr:hypothetical protein HDU92_004345 [Lobulomyces angularis]
MIFFQQPLYFILLSNLLLSVCTQNDTKTAAVNLLPDVSFFNSSVYSIEGEIKFKQEYGKTVEISVNISGLKPNSIHGWHIHEFFIPVDEALLNCTKGGGHFNPTSKMHGAPFSSNHHIGDLGNIKSDRKGRIRIKRYHDAISLFNDTEASILGHALVIHESKDDFVTQPTGNSGGRLGCGNIVEN